MSFCILYYVVSENHSVLYFPVLGEGSSMSFELSL